MHKHLSEETLSSEQIFKGRILDVYRDEVRLENGNTASREVIQHSGGVCVVAFTDADEVLFVSQLRYPHKAVLLEIPAGKLEPGEDHYLCGKRELLEETGYEAGTYEYLGALLPTPAYCSEVIHMYQAGSLSEPKAQNLDKDEFLDVSKIPFVQAIDMVMKGEITDAKTQIALLKAYVKRTK